MNDQVSTRPTCELTRDQLIRLRRVWSPLPELAVNKVSTLGLRRRRGCKAGRTKASWPGQRKHSPLSAGKWEIPVTTGNRQILFTNNEPVVPHHLHDYIGSPSINISSPPLVSAPMHPSYSVPKVAPIVFTLSSLFVLNAAALSKPQAVEHLAADLASYNIDVAVITETHFKVKHLNSVVGVDSYHIFRWDRARRRGGGVALY